jgi:hypothetical protein
VLKNDPFILTTVPTGPPSEGVKPVMIGFPTVSSSLEHACHTLAAANTMANPSMKLILCFIFAICIFGSLNM